MVRSAIFLMMSVIPMGIIARTVRALVAEILAQEFIVGLRAKGLTDFGIFRHVVKHAAPAVDDRLDQPHDVRLRDLAAQDVHQDRVVDGGKVLNDVRP